MAFVSLRGKLCFVLTQATLRKTIGRHRLERFIRAGWITPHVNGHQVLYDERDVRRAVKRLERGYGFELNGRAMTPTKASDPLGDLTIDLAKGFRQLLRGS